MGDKALPGKELIGGRDSEGEALVDVAAELAVVINVNRGGIIFIPTDQDSLLAGHETPAIGRLPVEIHEVGGVEHVPFIENLLVEPLTNAVVDLRGYMAKQMQVKVVSSHLAIVLPILSLLMEGGSHVQEEPVDTHLGRRQDGNPKQQEPDNDFLHNLLLISELHLIEQVGGTSDFVHDEKQVANVQGDVPAHLRIECDVAHRAFPDAVEIDTDEVAVSVDHR